MSGQGIPATDTYIFGKKLIVRSEQQAQNDSLMIEGGHPLTITVTYDQINIGCVALSFKAFEFIEKEVARLRERMRA